MHVRSPILVLLLTAAVAALAGVLVAAARELDDAGPDRSAAPASRQGDSERQRRGSAGAGEPRRSEAGKALETRRARPRIDWRRSVAVGAPEAGRLERGVRLPASGAFFFSWDPIRKRQPNRQWRRWGTDDLLRTTLGVLRGFARAHPDAPRIGIGDLSRPEGGNFGPQYGGIGHISHQNGLDADVYYPRRDEAERAPLGADQIDRRLSQDLVDRFVRAGAVKVFVGPNTGLTGPRQVVVPLVNHDNHLHVRISG